MDSATRMQYSPISLLRKTVRGDMVSSKQIKDLSAKLLRATEIVPHRYGRTPLWPSVENYLTWVVPFLRGTVSNDQPPVLAQLHVPEARRNDEQACRLRAPSSTSQNPMKPQSQTKPPVGYDVSSN